MSGRSGKTTNRTRGGSHYSPPRISTIALIAILPVLSACLYAASFPSFLSFPGWGFLGYIALIPYFYALLRLPLRACPLASAIFTATSFALMHPWLFSYHPAAPALVLSAMAISGAAFSLPMAFFLKRHRRFGFLAAACVWVGWEYVRSSGFLSFPYGTLGSSQYLNAPLLQSASLWGVWGLSFVLAAGSAFAARFIDSLLPRPGSSGLSPKSLRSPVIFLVAVFVFAHGAGFLFPPGSIESPKELSVLVLQPDNRPRRDGALPARWYAERILSLLDEGLGAYSDSDLVLSSETAFPPSIELRMASSVDEDDDRAVRDFMRSLSPLDLPLILGNDRGKFGLTPSGERDRLHYNAALLLESGKVVSAYEKNRLVPFIEYFPFYRAFPSVYRFVERENGILWTPGYRTSVFRVGGTSVGTPICFEDCFGDSCRDFVRAGAEVIAPMASDAWSSSAVAMRQHLANAVFRAVETRRPVIRASNNGITCAISPRGALGPALPAFSRGYASFRVAIPARVRTPYLLLGDWLPILCVLASIALACVAYARSPGRAAVRRRQVFH